MIVLVISMGTAVLKKSNPDGFRPIAGGNNLMFTGKGSSLSLLGKLAPEEKQKEMDATVTRRGVAAICQAFGQYCKASSGFLVRDYEACMGLAAKLRCTAWNIERFSLLLAGSQPDEQTAKFGGIFISALINNSKGKKFVIRTLQGGHPFSYIGYENKGKSIVIDGDAGNYTAMRMRDGKILVRGNAGRQTGQYMQNGEVTIEGRAGIRIGEGGGGIIRVGGAIRSIARSSRMEVYQAGRLVYKEGEKIGEVNVES